MPRRVFISFQNKDRHAKELLKAQSKNERFCTNSAWNPGINYRRYCFWNASRVPCKQAGNDSGAFDNASGVFAGVRKRYRIFCSQAWLFSSFRNIKARIFSSKNYFCKHNFCSFFDADAKFIARGSVIRIQQVSLRKHSFKSYLDAGSGFTAGYCSNSPACFHKHLFPL